MKIKQLGDREVPPVGFGCMGLSEFYGTVENESALALLKEAYEYGYKHFDTADMYGRGANEELLGEFLSRLGAGNRERVFLSTKAGIVRDPDNQFSVSVNSSYQYIMECCAKSLERLKTDYIDLYYLHRLNPETPLDETLRAMEELKKQGMIKSVGLCEVGADVIRDANAMIDIAAVQSEFSLWTRDVEQNILATCMDLDISFVAFSPLGRGFLTGNINSETVNKDFDDNDFRKRLPRFNDENIAKNEKTLKTLLGVSEEIQKTPAQIALAWVLSKSPNVHVIPGTKRSKYMKQNYNALNVPLSSQIIAKLDLAFVPENIHGERYPSAISKHSSK